ncbi:MAG TPA: GntR family transcriptional regulator [Planctomycetota bacterium]|nr:GntR family transcriptional regulator [Planctomycetota bacterium]
MAAVALSEKAYDQIQEAILVGRFPEGSVLSEATLAKELGMSRTPVSQAMDRLAADGLVQRIARYGTVVRSFTRQELTELYEVREALESFAITKAAERVVEETLTRLERYCQEMGRLADELRASGRAVLDGASLRRFLAADLAFHLLLVRTAGNARLMKLVQQTRTISRVFRMRRQQHDLRVVEGAHRYHGRVADALRRGDVHTAREQLVEHIRASQREASEHFDRQHQGLSQTGLGPTDLPRDLIRELERIERAAPEPGADVRPSTVHNRRRPRE